VPVVRTRVGSELAAAHHPEVCLEVDRIDERTRTGCIVLVRGRAEQVDEGPQHERARRTRPHPRAGDCFSSAWAGPLCPPHGDDLGRRAGG